LVQVLQRRSGTKKSTMKGKPGGRRQKTQTLLIVFFSVLCSLYVAIRMLNASGVRNALVEDLNDADGGVLGNRNGVSLAGMPRLSDNHATLVDQGNESYDETPTLAGQVDGIARGVVHGWGCENGASTASTVSVYVDGFLVKTELASDVRPDRQVGRICGKRPASSPTAGFSVPLPVLPPGKHEIRVFVSDATTQFKSELGGSPLSYEEAPSALGVAEELARKDRTIRDQNKLISQLQNQLGGDADLWSKTEGWGDGSSGDWSGNNRNAHFGDATNSKTQKHALHEFDAGAKHAGVKPDGSVTHAVTLASDAGKPGGEERLLAFIGVNTGFSSRARRDVLRDTWFPSGPALKQMETQHGLLFRFVIGEPLKSDEALAREIDAEIVEHDDFFRLKHTDTYDKLSDKTVMWFSAAVTTVDADFYMKIDDDIHLRVPELERFLVSHRLTRSMYFGCMKSGPVLSNPKQRWHEPEWWRFGDSGNHFFRHCTGQIYGVSRVVAQYIHDHRSILHRFANEDVSVGSWVMGLDVEFIDERNMCCQDCRGNGKCIATFQWRCSGVCDPLTNIPVIHNSCPQYSNAREAERAALSH